MAKYQVGDRGWYGDGVRKSPGEELILPDDVKPSRNFFPIDDAAKKAFQKHFPDLKSMPLFERGGDAEPRTLADVGRKAKGA